MWFSKKKEKKIKVWKLIPKKKKKKKKAENEKEKKRGVITIYVQKPLIGLHKPNLQVFRLGFSVAQPVYDSNINCKCKAHLLKPIYIYKYIYTHTHIYIYIYSQ